MRLAHPLASELVVQQMLSTACEPTMRTGKLGTWKGAGGRRRPTTLTTPHYSRGARPNFDRSYSIAEDAANHAVVASLDARRNPCSPTLTQSFCQLSVSCHECDLCQARLDCGLRGVIVGASCIQLTKILSG